MGVWRQYDGGVVVMHNGPLSPQQQLWVAVLAAGEGAVLAATSALLAAGVKVAAPPQPFVLSPFARHAPTISDAVLRRTRILTPADVEPLAQPPRLRIPRAAVDAASLCRAPDDVRAVLSAPVQQRRCGVEQLRQVTLRIGPVTGRGLILRTCDELERGATGLHEQRFSRIVRRHGLPEPTRQVMRKRGDGRAFLDVVWQEYGVHVEIDGLAHLEVGQWTDDLDRANELEIAKAERRLRFPGHLLIEREARVVDQLVRALTAGGWADSGSAVTSAGSRLAA
jgi:very-short-patch-repair endonuclease